MPIDTRAGTGAVHLQKLNEEVQERKQKSKIGISIAWEGSTLSICTLHLRKRPRHAIVLIPLAITPVPLGPAAMDSSDAVEKRLAEVGGRGEGTGRCRAVINRSPPRAHPCCAAQRHELRIEVDFGKRVHVTVGPTAAPPLHSGWVVVLALFPAGRVLLEAPA